MKPMLPYIFLCFLLASCTNVTIPTVTIAPQATFTSPPTKTPRPTTTITPNPTNTPDPLIGAPEGTTDIDEKTGEWIRTVVSPDGKTRVYTWNAERQEFYRLIIKFYLADQAPSSWGLNEDCIPLEAYVRDVAEQTTLFPTVTHLNITEDVETFSSQYLIQMIKGVTGKRITRIPLDEREKLYKSVKTGFPVKFTVGKEERIWIPSQYKGVKVYFEDVNSSALTADADSYEGENVGYGYGESTNIMKPPEVVDGWLVSTVSSKTPFSELPAKTIRALLIFHAASVIKTDDLAGQGFFTNLDILVQYAERGVPPYIDIQQ